ncbi:hypothetical protein MXB_5003 [Myxobolus squamalis]|nr:hypothetical protein MXB_5003 [Myxobolus squamalis]
MVRFPHKLWKNQSTDNSDGNAQMNNCLERYNRRLGKRFMTAHPNIFVQSGAIPYEFNFSHKRKKNRYLFYLIHSNSFFRYFRTFCFFGQIRLEIIIWYIFQNMN